uniref:Ovule protein n=1 Tax=Heterorhabditis bacteriophora TaxID=37862 RepID=A0A1I7XDV9_HETBA
MLAMSYLTHLSEESVNLQFLVNIYNFRKLSQYRNWRLWLSKIPLISQEMTMSQTSNSMYLLVFITILTVFLSTYLFILLVVNILLIYMLCMLF